MKNGQSSRGPYGSRSPLWNGQSWRARNLFIFHKTQQRKKGSYMSGIYDLPLTNKWDPHIYAGHTKYLLQQRPEFIRDQRLELLTAFQSASGGPPGL